MAKMTAAKMVKVRLTVSLSGTIEQTMTEEEWKALDAKLDDLGITKVDAVDINWADAVNALDGEIEEAELVE